MRQVIDRTVYNTDTATEIAEYWNGLPSNDFGSVAETLYKTAKGNYFLYGRGGPMTEYGESCGNNSWTSGSKIIPLSRESALEWCERRNEDVPGCLMDLVTEA